MGMFSELAKEALIESLIKDVTLMINNTDSSNQERIRTLEDVIQLLKTTPCD